MPQARRTLRVLALAASLVDTESCTAYIAGKAATVDGSVMLSHSDDGAGLSDARVAYIPAADHAPGSRRPIWPDTEDYPRFVGTSRGSVYAPILGQTETQPIGFIPEVAHTYAYLEANYAIQNECGLMFGESTASAVFIAGVAMGSGGSALLSVNEMTRLAAERVCSARAAVKLMGALAEQYGFYGADGGAGETLMVGDKEEGFVFHVLSDPSGESAIWVAQRIEDEHVAIISNMFIIREVNLTNSHIFIGSTNLHSVARAHGLWNGKGLLDFTKVYSRGEYGSKYYSGRRMWDGFRHMKPSLKLPAEYGSLKDDAPYPWSVKPDEKVSPRSWFAAYRSHYEGTPYDTTKGVAAGPFGTPDRYGTPDTPGDPGVGSWERTVAIYRTIFTWVVQANAGLANDVSNVVWWGPADASKTSFAPLMVSAGDPPADYTIGRQAKIDRQSGYWAVRYVQNLAQIRYSDMIQDIQAVSEQWEEKATALVSRLQANSGSSRASIKKALDAHAAGVRADYWQLADDLMVKYADGGLTKPLPDGSATSVNLGYPTAWLNDKAVNFRAGERLPDPAGFGPDPPLVGTATLATSTLATSGPHPVRSRRWSLSAIGLLAVCAAVLVGLLVRQRTAGMLNVSVEAHLNHEVHSAGITINDDSAYLRL